MEYQALYRKYRPQKFSDVVDQDNILKILTNSIKEGKISHAYLFSGPRGTGKTTIAKLVAKTVNCLNLNPDFSICGHCENCLDIEENSSDIIEIDAASNTGVEEIRELKSKINIVPSKLKYKVYIIDEVHMLSINAFNALLKTLEEPPSYVIFILATTEFYKVPTTIVSRCQCLNFTRIKTSSIEARLTEISQKENIKITPDAIHEIALYADGGLRDALGMLDKLSSYSLDEITLADFLSINGLISKSDIDLFISKILTNDPKAVIETLDKFDELGYDFLKLTEKIMEELRDLLVTKFTSNKEVPYSEKDLYDLIMVFNEIHNLLKEASNRRIIVEVKLLMFLKRGSKEEVVSKPERKVFLETQTPPAKNISRKINEEPELKNEKKIDNDFELNLKVKRERLDNTFALASKLIKNMVIAKFQNLDNYLTDATYNEVAGLLKDCSVGVASKTNIILTTKYKSVIEKLYKDYNRVLELLKKILEDDYVFVVLDEDEFKKEVENYKLHMKDKNYYNYKEESGEFITFKKLDVENNKEVCYSSLVQKAIDVFGSDYVEVE